jgi:transposase
MSSRDRMSNVLSAAKREQVVALGRLGWPLRRIEDVTGVRRETASRYLRAAGIRIRGPGRWGHGPNPAKEVSTDLGTAKPASEVSTDRGAGAKAAKEVSTDSAPPWPPVAVGRSPQASACAPYREVIEEALGRGRNAVAIYQDLVDAHGFPAGYASVRRYVQTLRGAVVPRAHAVIETAPGEEAQVDYGEGPMVRDPATGKYRRTRLFVLALGYSRKCVRLLTFQSSSQIWAALHEQALRRLGGCPRVMVLDNLKEGVLTPDIWDPTLNPLYRDVLAHYGIVALPCRVRDANRKGKVERGVGHAKNTPLKGMRFESLVAAQAYLDHWEDRWADTRIHGTTKRQVTAMFTEERPHLQPLPLEPFRSYEYGTRTVHLDGHVEVARAYYSVPPGHVGRGVWVQWDAYRVRILAAHTGQLLREHVRQQPGRHRTAREDRPAPTPKRVEDLLARAGRAGPHIGALCQLIFERERDLGSRRILGVLALTRRLGPVAVEDACAAALEVGVPTYRFVRRYVERRSAPPLTLRQVDPLIRQLSHYRDLITQLTAPADDEESPL